MYVCQMPTNLFVLSIACCSRVSSSLLLSPVPTHVHYLLPLRLPYFFIFHYHKERICWFTNSNITFQDESDSLPVMSLLLLTCVDVRVRCARDYCKKIQIIIFKLIEKISKFTDFIILIKRST